MVKLPLGFVGSNWPLVLWEVFIYVFLLSSSYVLGGGALCMELLTKQVSQALANRVVCSGMLEQ